MTKLSDYVIDFIFKQGVGDIFMFSGGGCMHLIDSVGQHGKIRYVCNLHEQAGAIAAEGYARIRDDVGVCLVTTGPGGTNAITGVIGSWLDSIPTVFISGQVKREMMRPFSELRQLGDQEINIIDIVKPVTKYAVTVQDENKIQYHLEKAFHIARNGRPGPVWIDIPLDVQSANIDENTLKGFDSTRNVASKDDDVVTLEDQVETVLEMIKVSERPVILVGKGVRLADAQTEFLELVGKLKIPVITSFSGYDIIDHGNRYYQGRQGTVGPRAGNLIVQNSDFLLCLGTRMNTRMTSYNYESFAREAKKVMVDIDEAEHRKPIMKPDVSIIADAKEFIVKCLEKMGHQGAEEKTDWMEYCRKVNGKYPVVTKENYKKKDYVDSYAFVKELSDRLQEDDTIVLANGLASTVPYQVLEIKKGQRVIVNSGCAAMGYELPASIGASVGLRGKPVICIAGDGSIQLNIQELQTIRHYDLPIKIFIFNNNGYLSIRETQKAYFQSRFVASSSEFGVSLPDMQRIANAYEIPYECIKNNEQFDKLDHVLASGKAIICEVMLDPEQGLATKAASSVNEQGKMIAQPLENLAPFLPREELKGNMFIPMWDEK